MEHTFHHQTMAVYTMIQKQVFTALRPKGLSSGQPKILEYLNTHDGASNKEIAKACYIEPATLSSVLTRMEKLGLVTRRIPEENRRRVEIQLTDAGRALAAEVVQEFARAEAQALAGISTKEREQFLTIFAKVQDNLSKQ